MRSSSYFYFLVFVFCVIGNRASAQYINVDTSSYTAAQMVANFIGTTNASCITISNVSVTGKDFGGGNVSYGYFDKGTSSFKIDKGIILSTGSAKAAEGFYAGNQTHNNSAPFYAPSWGGDLDLSDAIQQVNLYNATTLEFDFKTSLSDKISFDYMFASDEYYSGNRCSYSDAFAFLIKEANDPLARYENIAVVPGTSIPVSSTTVNKACNMNVDYFDDFNTLNDPNVPFNFGGQTIVMTARANIKPGIPYHIKLVIADQGTDQGKYDSAVFLKEGSFTGNIDLLPNLASNDAAIICNGVPVTMQPKNPSDISDPLATYDWYRDGALIAGEHSPSLQTAIPANYKLKVTLSSLCTLEANIKLINAPTATYDLSPIPLCDRDFDLDYTTKLSDYNSQIVTNYDSSIYDVAFYDNPLGAGTPITSFNFTQNSKTLYVKANAYGCDSGLPKAIQFQHGPLLSMNYPQTQTSPPTFDICDDDLVGSKEVDLKAFVDNKMTTETGTGKTFYLTESEAKKGDLSNAITDVKPKFDNINSDKTYFVRIEKSNSCPNYSSFRLLFKQPKRSMMLKKDTVVCKGALTDLDAGPGFDSYRWYNEADPLKATISTSHDVQKLPVGNYIVELGFNDCVYSQPVKISEPADLSIDNVLIEGNQVTVFASNGIPPYRIKLDGVYQPSNVFDVPKGDHTIEVEDACGSVRRDFSIINVKNVITPNDDNVNDTIDYSDLMTKLEPRLEIYDRNGVLVFKGSPENQYIWNGKLNGRPLPTSSYWYILEWNESGNPKRVQHTGWILLKNRN